MRKTMTSFIAVAAALLLCASAGAANLTVEAGGLGPETSAACPSGCKLAVNLTMDTVKAHVIDNSPEDERIFRFGFQIHPNELPMNERTAFRVAEIRGASPGKIILIVSLFYRNGQHKARFNIIDDNGANLRVGQFDLRADKKALIEGEWQASSGADADDAFMRIRKGTKVKEATGLDMFLNGTEGIDQVKFGYVKAGDATVSGAYWLDTYSSFRTLEPFTP